MATGDSFSPEQRHRIDRAIREAEQHCRLELSVFVGTLEGDRRQYAEDLHRKLVAPDKSVLILVDPAARQVEVVTGAQTHAELTDDEVRLAVAEMTAMFAEQELVDGIITGVNAIARFATN